MYIYIHIYIYIYLYICVFLFEWLLACAFKLHWSACVEMCSEELCPIFMSCLRVPSFCHVMSLCRVLVSCLCFVPWSSCRVLVSGPRVSSLRALSSCRVLVCRVVVCRVLVCRVLVCRVLVCRGLVSWCVFTSHPCCRSWWHVFVFGFVDLISFCHIPIGSSERRWQLIVLGVAPAVRASARACTSVERGCVYTFVL